MVNLVVTPNNVEHGTKENNSGNEENSSHIQPKILFPPLSFMNEISVEERNEINTKLYNIDNKQNIVNIFQMATVQTSHFRTLCLGIWLSNEVIHYFFHLLKQRDTIC